MKKTKRKWTKSLVISMVSLLMVGGLPWHELRADANTHGEYECSPLFVTYDQTATWDLNTQGEFTITNTSETVVDSWTLEIVFATDLEIANLWNGLAISDEITPANTLVIGNESYNATINPGESVSFGMEMVGTELAPVAPTSVTLTNVILEEVQTEEESISSEETTEETTEETNITEDITEDFNDEVAPVEEVVPASLSEDENAVFSYAIFAESDISFNGWKSTVTGDIYSGGDYLYQGSELYIDGYVRTVGTIQPQGWTTSMTGSTENIEPIPMPDWSSLILSKEESMNPLTDDDLTSQNSIIVNGFYRTEGSVTINSAEFGGDVVIVATGDITLNIDTVSGDGRIILYSETGNITINGSQAVFNGILYAPNGSISLNAYDITVNGRIVANSFSYSGSILSVISSEDDFAYLFGGMVDGGSVNEESTDDTSNITVWANKSSIIQGTSGEYVEFFVCSEANNIASVGLYENGIRMTEMYDNGNYTNAADDIGGDGVYSARVYVDNRICQENIYTFIITTVNGYELTYTLAVPVVCSDDICGSFDAITAAVGEYYYSELYNEDDVDTRIETIMNILSELEDQGIVAAGSIHVFDTSYVCCRASSGAMIIYPCEERDPQHNEISTNNTGALINLQNSPASTPAQQGEVLYMIGFNDRGNAYEIEKDQLEAEGISVDLWYSPSYSDYCTCLSLGYDFVVFSGHGSYDNSDASEFPEPFLLTGIYLDSRDTTNKPFYLNEANNGLIGFFPVRDMEGVYEIALRTAFFTEYYPNSISSNSIVLFENCELFGFDYDVREDFGATMTSLGVPYCIGFENSVECRYPLDLYTSFIISMCNGNSTGEAYQFATGLYGADDSAYDPEAPIAYAHAYGDSTYHLSARSINNASFEYFGNVYGPSLNTVIYEWYAEGDAKVLSVLADVSPTDGDHMVAISTGIGSGESAYFSASNASSISQSFWVPENQCILYCDINMISEEPMEWVGSSFDDRFDIIIQDLTTGIEGVVYTNSINSAEWYYLSGVNFAGGDATAYQTGWIEVECDLSGCVNHNVRIVFAVYDVGDSAYDTAVLIDNLRLG